MKHQIPQKLAASFLVTLLLSFQSWGSSLKGQLEITVVGSVHSSTPKFTEDTLVKILNRIKPDLILLELDPSFFDNSLNLLERYQSVSLESRAAISYAKTSPTVLLRPFDIEGRNRFYQEQDYFNRELKLNQQINSLYANGQLSSEAKVLYESLTSSAAIRDRCGAGGPEVMNSGLCDQAIEKKQYVAFKGIGKIVELTSQLADYKQFWNTADDFWTRRNNAMVMNIVKYSKEPGHKRIVVICGFEHRYFLRKELGEMSNKEAFSLREYQDY